MCYYHITLVNTSYSVRVQYLLSIHSWDSKQPMIDIIFPTFLLFLFSFNMLVCLFLLFRSVLSSILYVNVCVSVSCLLIFFFLWYRIKNNSPILCQLFWPTSFLWQQQQVFSEKFTIFSFILESVSKIHEKCGTIGVHS